MYKNHSAHRQISPAAAVALCVQIVNKSILKVGITQTNKHKPV